MSVDPAPVLKASISKLSGDWQQEKSKPILITIPSIRLLF
jgi:hypothetical protein